jgi:hypothetical protein
MSPFDIIGIVTLKPRGRPLGRSLRLGALGLGRFRARPPITGMSYVIIRNKKRTISYTKSRTHGMIVIAPRSSCEND